MESMVSSSGNEQGTYFSQIFTLILSVAIVMTGFGIIFPIFPQLLEIVGGGDERDLGIMAAFFGLAYLIASPIFGNVADKYGKKRVILIGLLGFSTSNLVYVYASELWQFYLARAIEGAFSSAILPPAIALTTQLTPKKVRARYIGYVVSGNTIGLIIGPLLGGVLYDGIIVNGTTLVVGSLYLPFWVSFAVGLFAFTFGVVFLPSARSMDPGLYPSKTADTEHQRIQKILEFRGTTPKAPRTLVVEEPQAPSGSIMSRLLNRQLDSLPKPLAMFFIFALADTLTVLPWLIVSPGFIFYFYGTLELTASDFGYFVAAYGLFAASGQALLGNISDRVGRKPVILVGQIFSIFFYLTMPLGRLVWQFMLIASLAGIASGLRDPAMKALLSDVTDEKTRATAFGIESGLISVSQIAGPLLGGFLAFTYGMDIVFIVSIGISILNLFFVSIIRFRSQNILETPIISPIQVVAEIQS